MRRKPKDITELSEAAKQDVSRAEALNDLYRPLQDAAEAELENRGRGGSHG